jgi:aspartate carbamoyltransferase catalytic subunit
LTEFVVFLHDLTRFPARLQQNSSPRKDLFGIEHLPVEVIDHLLDRSDHFYGQLLSSEPYPNSDLLQGRTIANLFFENSTRTRFSFELAEQRLGGQHISFTSQGTSVSKGESLLDTVKVLEAMKLDAIVVRHSSYGVPQFIAKHVPDHVHVINAGDGAHEHPTQALLDAATMRMMMGTLKNRKVAIIGDIRHSRVARSNIWLLKKYGCDITLVGPDTLISRNAAEVFDVDVRCELGNIIHEVDVVIALRIQLERQASALFPTLEEFTSMYGITEQRLAGSKAHLLHPGPVNIGVELDFAAVYGEQSVILRQVKRGVAVRMAVLEWVFSK